MTIFLLSTKSRTVKKKWSYEKEKFIKTTTTKISAPNFIREQFERNKKGIQLAKENILFLDLNNLISFLFIPLLRTNSKTHQIKNM